MVTNWPGGGVTSGRDGRGRAGSAAAAAVVAALAVLAAFVALTRAWRSGTLPVHVTIQSLVLPNTPSQRPLSPVTSVAALLVAAVALALVALLARSVWLAILAALTGSVAVVGFAVSEGIRVHRAGGHLSASLVTPGLWAGLACVVLLWVLPWVMPLRRWR